MFPSELLLVGALLVTTPGYHVESNPIQVSCDVQVHWLDVRVPESREIIAAAAVKAWSDDPRMTFWRFERAPAEVATAPLHLTVTGGAKALYLELQLDSGKKTKPKKLSVPLLLPAELLGGLPTRDVLLKRLPVAVPAALLLLQPSLFDQLKTVPVGMVADWIEGSAQPKLAVPVEYRSEMNEWRFAFKVSSDLPKSRSERLLEGQLWPPVRATVVTDARSLVKNAVIAPAECAQDATLKYVPAGTLDRITTWSPRKVLLDQWFDTSIDPVKLSCESETVRP